MEPAADEKASEIFKNPSETFRVQKKYNEYVEKSFTLKAQQSHADVEEFRVPSVVQGASVGRSLVAK